MPGARSHHPAIDAMQAARRTADDLDTIWRSEMAALAVDREGQELWTAGLASWSAHGAARWTELFKPDDAAAATGTRTDRSTAGERTGPDAPPRTAPADAAPDPVPEHRHVADLERRLAELERLARRDG